MSKRSMALAVAVVAALLAGLVVAGDAQTQDARLEAAKKEGKVVWYTSLVLPSAERVAKLFETAYPDVKVEVHRTGSQRILQRVMQELQANIKNVDVVHTSDAGHYVLLKEKKLLAKYTPAGVDAFPAGFKDKDGYYYGLRATVNAITYNTKTVPAAEAPKTWKDLLDPQWKGKMVTAHPGHSRRVPSAAGLFTDFTFTREVQQVMADSEGLYTGHPDVTYPADKPKLKDLKLLTVTPEELEKRNEELKKRFVEFFGA